MDQHFPRPPSPDERAVLDKMLTAPFDGADGIRERVANVVVTGGCGCGCPTIYFDGGVTSDGMNLVAEGTVAAGDVAVLVFTSNEGELVALELMWMTEGPPAAFPAPDQLTVSAR